MNKYKLYFKKPVNITMPPGDWKPYLPEIVLKHMKLIGVIISIITIAAVLLLNNAINKNGELTDLITNRIKGIDNTAVRALLAAPVLLITIAALMFVHEMLHLLITVGKGDMYIYWNKTMLGFSPFSDCELTWRQTFIYKLLPFAVLSVGFYIISLIIGGEIGGFLKWLAMINLALSSFDLLFTPFMFLIPRNAVFYGGGLWQIRKN